MKEELYQALDSLASAYAEPNIKEDGLPRFMILGKKAKAYGMVKKAIDKLGQLEDLEEELGIELITLFKALKNGIWIYDNGSPFFTSRIKLSWHLDAIYCDTSDTYVLLKDYGKTWALTKEELECHD